PNGHPFLGEVSGEKNIIHEQCLARNLPRILVQMALEHTDAAAASEAVDVTVPLELDTPGGKRLPPAERAQFLDFPAGLRLYRIRIGEVRIEMPGNQLGVVMAIVVDGDQEIVGLKIVLKGRADELGRRAEIPWNDVDLYVRPRGGGQVL